MMSRCKNNHYHRFKLGKGERLGSCPDCGEQLKRLSVEDWKKRKKKVTGK